MASGMIQLGTRLPTSSRRSRTTNWRWNAARIAARRRISAATKAAQGRDIRTELERAGVITRSRSHEGLAEEQPSAYKDVDEVVDVVHRAGLSLKVARLAPLGVIKG